MSTLCETLTEIADITIPDCIESFGQLQKVVFQNLYSTGTTKNTIADPTLLASWSSLVAASDLTKVVISPYIEAPTPEAGAARRFGSGNEVKNGIGRYTGREPSTFEGVMYDARQDTVGDMKAYQKYQSNGIWMVNQDGYIGCLTDDVATPTTYYPIPIHALFVGDKTFGGLEESDKNAVSWMLAPNWSDKFIVVKPSDFNALTDLAA